MVKSARHRGVDDSACFGCGNFAHIFALANEKDWMHP
jgi:hypothetical protein